MSILRIDIFDINKHRNASRRQIEIKKHTFVGKTNMARDFNPFSIRDVPAQQIGTIDWPINR